MPKKLKKSKKLKNDSSKSDVEGFLGSLPVNLDRVMSDGSLLRDNLRLYIGDLLDTELRNQEKRLKKIADWERLYNGSVKDKVWPHEHAANLNHPLIPSDVDAIHVRELDTIFNKRKIVIAKATKPESVGLDREIEDYLDWFLRNIIHLEEKLQSPILQADMTGTGIVFIDWKSEKRTCYRYATDADIQSGEKLYDLPGTKTKGVKYIRTIYEGPQLYAIPRDSFVKSSNALTIKDALLSGFKTDVRKPQVDLKVRQGLYDEKEADTMVGPDEPDEVKEGRAENQQIELNQTEAVKPFEIWRLWTKYDVDEDGEEDDIVITYHRSSGAILSCIYNPLFIGFKPFVDLVPDPRAYSFDGRGIAEILEHPQIELTAMHNQRLDRLTQINTPVFFVKSGSSLEKLEQIEPGKIYVADDDLENILKEFRWSDVTYSSFQEEDRLLALADRLVGITPSVLGISTAERPVAKETMSNMQEANKKFIYRFKNLRKGIIEIVYMLLEFMAQYQPAYSYDTQNGGQMETRTIKFPIELIRDGLDIQLYASTEMINQELRREMHLALYHLMSDYYTKTGQMVQAIVSPKVPSEFKKFLISIIEKGDKRIDNILRDFDQVDSESDQVNIGEVIDVQKAIAQSVDLMPPRPPMPPPGPEGGPQGLPQGPQGPPMPQPGGIQ